MSHLARPNLRISFSVTLTAALLCCPRARAAPYEPDISIDSESDLYDLQARGDISAETLETLVDLLRSGVDLNRATAEELYELPGITERDVELVLARRSGELGARPGDPTGASGALDEKRLRGLNAFLVGRDSALHPGGRPNGRVGFSGTLEILSQYTAGDPIAPPGWLRGRLKLPMDLSLGFSIISTRQRLGPISWDPARDAFVAEPARYGVALPKFFLLWRGSRLSVIAGTFRIGFGERLTLDNTRRQTPHGFQADDALQRGSDLARFCRYSLAPEADDQCGARDQAPLYVTPDPRWQEGFRGIAASLDALDVGTHGRLELHAFASHQPRSIYQYELFNRDLCVDPGSNDEQCRAPPVFEAGARERRLSQVTLPAAFDEVATGGNASLAFGRLTRVGVTGYFAAPLWRTSGARIDFQDSSGFPSGGPFGAVGLSASSSAGGWHLSAEAARSFDRTRNGGGGIGLVQRSVRVEPDSELELTLRYFDALFVNPHSRPISAPDELEGSRARNEAGARFRYMRQLNEDWRIGASADVWLPPEDGNAQTPAVQPKLAASARTEILPGPSAALALWGSHMRGPIALGPSRCTCGGEDYRAGARASLAPFGRRVELSVQYTHALSRQERDPSAIRQDASIWADLIAAPSEALRFHLRTRYLDQDVADDASLERSWATWLEAAWSPSALFRAAGRYELYAWLDARESTRARRPNPEHRFRLEMETRF